MANLKYYNSVTEEWETLVVGKQGPTGPQGVPGNDGALSPNAVINGGFDIWQRGTTQTVNNSGAYVADRFIADDLGVATITQQTFTPGQAPATGNEGQYFLRYNKTSQGFGLIEQRIEDVRTFAGQTVTFSFWAKAGAALNVTGQVRQFFGTGGSSNVNTELSVQNVSTSWNRYSWTFQIPSISGKTLGAGSYLHVRVTLPSTGTYTFDTWGWQLEAGSAVTPFRRNANSLAGELAACQRYYYRTGGNTPYDYHGTGSAGTTNSARILVLPKQTMRVAPTSIDFANLGLYDSNSTVAVTSCTFDQSTSNSVALALGVSSGLTQFRPYLLISNNSFSGFIGLSSEL
jgi:hypothetical protein